MINTDIKFNSDQYMKDFIVHNTQYDYLLIQIKNIHTKLKQWMKDRKLQYKDQQDSYLANIYEEASEYYRAVDYYSKVDALCDISVFTFNCIEHFSIEVLNNHIENYKYKRNIYVSDIIEKINKIYKHYPIIDTNNYYTILIMIFNHLKNIALINPILALEETIKEISSRTQDPIQKEIWDKLNKGETFEELKEQYKDYSNLLTMKFIKDTSKKAINKWYKADYSKCKLS